MIDRAVAGGLISGFSIRDQTESHLTISNLLFTDDTLSPCGANLDHIWYLRGVFVWFQAISRLKINLFKSELVPVGDVLMLMS